MFVLLLFYVSGALAGGVKLICPPNVKSFAFGVQSNSYYTCPKEGAIAILTSCPNDEVYWAYKKICWPQDEDSPVEDSISESSHSDLRSYEQPLLGRVAYLGDLYDARNNEILSGESFWKAETKVKYKMRSESQSSILDFVAAETTLDRLSHMDISASLKLDFLGGMISVKGSAGYLRDSIESEDIVSVILKYHATTHSETIPIETPKDFEKLCASKRATHVITTLTYGMGANFVFKKRVRADESREQITGMLDVAVKSIPAFQIEGHAEVNISGSIKKTTQEIDIKLYGDFVLPKQPTTYKDCILVYQTLPSYLGTPPSYSTAAKIRMKLTPITRFCDKADTILISISTHLIDSISRMLGEIEKTKMKINTLAMMDPVHQYLPLKKILQIFTTELDVFELSVKSDLQNLLPNIRGGGPDSSETGLIKLLMKYAKSPFNYDVAENFLKTRGREIKMMQFMLDPSKFKGTDIQTLDYENANDDQVFFKNEFVLMVTFNILPSEDIIHKFLKGEYVNERTSWFNRPDAVAYLGKLHRNFAKFSSANTHVEEHGFLFALYDTKEPLAEVFASANGNIFTKNFTFPEVPPKLSANLNEYNSISFAVQKPNNQWVKECSIEYWKFGRKEDSKSQNYPLINDHKFIMRVNNLTPNNVYQFILRYTTPMGRSEPSPISEPIVTRPCSVPTNLRWNILSSNRLKINWDLPTFIGKGVAINKYKVQLSGKDFLQIKDINYSRSVEFTNLKSATPYKVWVKAVATINGTTDSAGISSTSMPAELQLFTLPNAPPTPTLVDVSFHYAQIIWLPPTRIAFGAVIKDYQLKYSMMDNKGSKEKLGTEKVQSSFNKTSLTLKGLVQGTTYAVRVKVATTLGDSGYSSILIIKTSYKQTELAALRESVEREIKNSVFEESKKIREEIGGVSSTLNNKIGLVAQDISSKIYHASENLNEGIRQEALSRKTDIADANNKIGHAEDVSNKIIQEASIREKVIEGLYAYEKFSGYNDGYGNREIGIGWVPLVHCFRLCYKKKYEEKYDVTGISYARTYSVCYCDTGALTSTTDSSYVQYRLRS